jgi:serine/threonine-protein kinase
MHTTEQLNVALAGRYAIDRLVGEGGMATVYLARDLRHQRRVALKVLKPDLGAVVGVERFLSEIQVTANLQHPNLLPLFDSGAADDVLFYVMPYVDGESLRARLEREKQLPVDEAVRLAAAVASALDYAHRHGVIHRDLKPENILLHEGQPLVADFGIALAVSNAGGNRITQTGLSLGTPQYMSPEQATGDRVIDARTDVFSLGAVTYEMLTGEAPHTGTTSQAIIARLLTEKPRAIRASRPSVPAHVEAAVDLALEKLPADRWATTKEFGEALTGARQTMRQTSDTTGATADAMRAARRRLATRELAAWTVAAVAIAAAAFVSLRPSPDVPGVPAEFELLDSIDVTSNRGAASLALSRDGSTLVFQAARSDGTPMLFVRRLDDRSVQPISGTDDARSPVLSPDGSEVLFSLLGGGGFGALGASAIRRVPVRGGRARTVVDSAVGTGQVSWGDAGLIVVAHRARLWTVPEDGGPRTLLAAPDSTRRHMRYGFPDVLPGGKAALITVWRGGIELDSAMVGVVSIPGGEVTELGIRGTYPRYSATGHIVYGTSDGWLFAVPFVERTRAVSGIPVRVADGVRVGAGGAAAVGVARNGTLAYIRGLTSLRRELRLVAVSRTGTMRPLGGKPGFYADPRVSPDGGQVAVTVATTGEANFPNPDIWRFDTASKVFARVTTDSSSIRAAWSRDGERIAYARSGGDSVVMWRPLYANGQATPLFRSTHVVTEASLGPPQGYSAISVRFGVNRSEDIWLVPTDSLEAPRAFLAEPYTESAPRISPNGNVIAYVTNRTGRSEVYVRPILGDGPEVQVSVDGGVQPVWAPSGRELFYVERDVLMSARFVEGRRLAVLRRDSLFRDVFLTGGRSANYDVFPDGRELLMLRPDSLLNSNRLPLIVRLNWHARTAARADAGDR